MKFKEYRKFWFDLQMFNDGDDNDDGAGDGAEKEPKMVSMTQADFDAKFNKAFAKGSKKSIDEFKGSDEYKELLKLKEANATDAEKTKERLAKFDESMKELEALRSENADLKNSSKISGLKDPKQKDYVLFEIKKLMDDKTDFDDALKKFQESDPQYWESEEDGDNDKGQPFRSSAQKKRNNNQKSKAEEYLERRGRSSRYKRK